MNQNSEKKLYENLIKKCINEILKKEKEIVKISLDKEKIKEQQRKQKLYDTERERTRKNFRNTLWYFDLPLDLIDFDNYFSDELPEIQELYKNFLNDLKKIIDYK